MKISVYGIYGTRSDRVQWTLEELGLEYVFHTVNLKRGETKSKAYLSINPFGQIPCLTLNGIAYNESAAISVMLCERFEESDKHQLIPTLVDSGRHQFWFWMFYATTQLDPASFQLMLQSKASGDTSALYQKFVAHLENIERTLETQKFIVKDYPTLPDFVIYNCLRWNSVLIKTPRIKKYMTDLSLLPSYKKMRENQGA
jgi:glutathione S-transferase